MKISLFVGLFSLMANTFAAQCGIHTWHDVVPSSGDWSVSIKMINQQGYFVDTNCDRFSQADISPSHKLVYGFGFEKGADFDIAYTLTAVNKESSMFHSKTCVFVISATGPAQPQITAISYHGAQCDWKVVPGVGENFYVS